MSFTKKALVFVAAVVVIAAAIPTFAIAQAKFQQVIVANADSAPVPVKAPAALPVRAPLWQGTPYVSNVNLGLVNGTDCDDRFVEIPAGKTLYIDRIATTANLDRGGALGGQIVIDPLGAEAPTTVLDIPLFQGASIQNQANGVISDRYFSTLEVGFPVDRLPQACLVGLLDWHIEGVVRIIGYLVDAS